MGDIFWRLVQIPTNKLYEYYTRFRSFINSPGRKLEHYGISLPERDPAESRVRFLVPFEPGLYLIRGNKEFRLFAGYVDAKSGFGHWK